MKEVDIQDNMGIADKVRGGNGWCIISATKTEAAAEMRDQQHKI